MQCVCESEREGAIGTHSQLVRQLGQKAVLLS